MSPLPSFAFISSSQEGLSQRRGRSARSLPPGLLLYGAAFPRPPHPPPLPRGFVGTEVPHRGGLWRGEGGVLLTQLSAQCSRGRNKAERGQMHRVGACAARLRLAGWWPGDRRLLFAAGPGSSACFPPMGTKLLLPWKRTKGTGRPPEPASLTGAASRLCFGSCSDNKPPPHTPPAPLAARGITPHR